MDETVLVLKEASDTCRYTLLIIIHTIIVYCRESTSTLMSTAADFTSSMKYLVLDKLNEFSIILHCKFVQLYKSAAANKYIV